MKRLIVAAAILSVTVVEALAQTTVTPTTIHGGQILSDIVGWAGAAFGAAIASLLVAMIYKISAYFGVQTTQQQRDQLQSIILNGLNSAAAKAQSGLGGSSVMDLNVKNQIIADAVAYTQSHGADTIKALGLDPQSGQAVEAIKAKMTTLVADKNQPTSPAADAAVAATAK